VIAPIVAPAPISEFEEAEAPTSAFSFSYSPTSPLLIRKP
jgi:hypothetical protein